MADNILKNIPLPADLPENWTSGQIIAPTGAEAGLDDQHGYNYLMKQVNNAQKAATALNDGKAAVVAPHTFTIPTTGWVDDTSVADFPHKLDISIEELTAQDIVNVAVNPDDTTPAADACFANTETLQGILRLRAKDVPTAVINATWYIVR